MNGPILENKVDIEIFLLLKRQSVYRNDFRMTAWRR